MDRTQLRVDLLRIAFTQTRDDNLALDIAKRWEPWVLETLDDKPAKEKKSANPART